MPAYIARRILLASLTMIIMSMLTFVVVSLPEGDYVDELVLHAQQGVGDQMRAEADQMREYYGLDKPAIVQYFRWVSRIVTKLEFAHSYGRTTNYNGLAGFSPGRDVTEIIAEPMKLTIALTAFTIALTWMMGIPIGIYSAVRQHSIGDYVFTFAGFTGLAVPDFLLGLVMMWVFFARRYLDLSVGGLFSGNYAEAPWSAGKVVDLMQHLIIPAVVLGTSGTAGLIRIMRNNLLDELSRPYVTTARAKGLPGWKVVIKYPVRVAINPFISSIGQMLPALVGGSVIVSVVLSLPTLGPILLESIMDQDMYLAGAIILLLGLLTVIGILVSDLLLVLVDPRIKLFGR